MKPIIPKTREQYLAMIKRNNRRMCGYGVTGEIKRARDKMEKEKRCG